MDKVEPNAAKEGLAPDPVNALEQLSLLGMEIASALSLEKILTISYEGLNALLSADVFAIGLYKPDEAILMFSGAIERGQKLNPFSIPLFGESHLAALCFDKQTEIVINEPTAAFTGKTGRLPQAINPGEPASCIFLPLWHKGERIGVITAQSFEPNAFGPSHVAMLRNLANYIALALRNADAHWRVQGLVEELRTAQDKLIIQSKLAGIGEITAGIAHEIQNPLNFVTNFSELSNELLDEMKEDLLKGDYSKAVAIFDDIRQNLDKIKNQGKRADSIVKGMLQHSRGVPGHKELTDINELADEYLRLAYHGLRAKDKSFIATMRTDFDPSIGEINIVPQEIGRVILNLLTNAFFAVNERRKLQSRAYDPIVSISTRRCPDQVEIKVSDNGGGIPRDVLDKIFQPFFSTKPSGQGTGLGLTLSREIVTKGHGGELKVETLEGEGSTFIIFLPI